MQQYTTASSNVKKKIGPKMSGELVFSDHCLGLVVSNSNCEEFSVWDCKGLTVLIRADKMLKVVLFDYIQVYILSNCDPNAPCLFLCN